MVGGEAARGEEPGKCVRPDGPSSSQAEGGLDEVGRDGPGMAAPSHASVSGVELKDRTQGARAHIGEGDWQGPGHEQAGRGQGPAGSTSQPPWRPRARPIGSGHGKSAGPRDGPRSPGRSARNGTARRARLAHSGRAARCRPRSTGREGQGRRVRAVSELNLPGFAVRQAPRITGRHSATTCTETSIRSQASCGPSQKPERGEALSCSRATATETCSEPTSLLFVGSKPRQPAPGI